RPRRSAHPQGRLRPCPAIDAVRLPPGPATPRRPLCRDRRQGEWRKPRHDQLAVFPPRCLPFAGFWIFRRGAPQFERRRPQTEAEDNARSLGCRVVPTWAPIEAVLAVLIAGTQRGLRAAASCVF